MVYSENVTDERGASEKQCLVWLLQELDGATETRMFYNV